MDSEVSSPVGSDVGAVTDKTVRRSPPNKKNQVKVPKKIHKAEREKLKRDYLNELFFELGNALDPAQQNNGKASILGDATRLLKDLLSQIDSLRRENQVLLSESHYVTVEKNELIEDTSALKAQVGVLQSQIEERVQSRPIWNLDPSQLQHSDNSMSQPAEDRLMLPLIDHTSAAPFVAPLFVIPLHQDLQAYPEHDNTPDLMSKLPSNVSKPHARYPSPSDSWPSQILPRPISGGSGTSSSNKGDKGLAVDNL